MKKLSQHKLKSLFRYEPQTGNFYRKLNVYTGKGGLRWRAGSVAGCDSHGYTIISIGKCKYSAHVLAWVYMTGEWPKNEIDHIDLNRANNAWSNLRQASHQENACNAKKRANNKSGFKGVSTRGNNQRWYAHIRKMGRTFYIGTFDSKIDAALAYDSEAKKLHGQFAKLNF